MVGGNWPSKGIRRKSKKDVVSWLRVLSLSLVGSCHVISCNYELERRTGKGENGERK